MEKRAQYPNIPGTRQDEERADTAVDKKYFSLWGKGVAVGASMLLPGLSGGTMAIILGIYDRLIAAISSFFKNPKKNLIFLAVFALGGCVGILVFSKALLYVTEQFEVPMLYLFMGAVLGSIPILVKQTRAKRFSPSCVIYPLIGVALVVAIDLLPSDLLDFGTTMSFGEYLLLAVCGIFLAVALILPGISFSYMLLVLGIYDLTLKAVESLQLLFLLSLGVGVLLGIVLCTRVLDICMSRYPQKTYLVIIGFVLGSLKDVFPGFPAGMEIIYSLLTFAVGLIGIYWLTQKFQTV